MFRATRLPLLTACVLVLAAACGLAATGPASRPAGEAGGLRLVPKGGPKDPSAPKELTASRWVCASPKDILGRGTDTVLQFHKGEDQKLTVDRVTRTFRSVNDRGGGAWGQKFDEKKETFPAAVEGPVLRCGDEQQTFAVTDKVLVLNALVPVGEGRWYYAARQNWGKGGHRDEEMLLEFADDPTKKDEGGGTIQLTSSNGPAILKESVRFTLSHANKQGRLIKVESADAQNRGRRAEILFPPDGAYGLVLDRPNLNSRVFTAEAAGK